MQPPHYLAHLNVAAMKFALDAPEMADFNANLDRINALAEASPGFVWRYQSAEGDTTEAEVFGPTTLVNLSVWQDVHSLHAYAYGEQHGAILRRRREWFTRMPEASLVLWWVPAGQWPTLQQARERLETLQQHGPTPAAFDFSQPFPAPQ
jgi:hypothetical protein